MVVELQVDCWNSTHLFYPISNEEALQPNGQRSIDSLEIDS